MESSLPKSLPKASSSSRSIATNASRLKPSSSASLLRLSALPTLPKIREESHSHLQAENNLLAVHSDAECALSDLPDPAVLLVSGQSAPSDLSPLSSVVSSDVTEEHKVLFSGADCLAGLDHALPDLPRSSAKGNLLVPKVHGEHLNKGKSDEVISPLDLIIKSLDEINQAKDVLDDTKKIMDAMFVVAVQQLHGINSVRREVRAADPYVIIKLRFATLLLIFLFLVVRLVFKRCVVDDGEWPYGLTPT